MLLYRNKLIFNALSLSLFLEKNIRIFYNICKLFMFDKIFLITSEILNRIATYCMTNLLYRYKNRSSDKIGSPLEEN